jgi:hypothetical protein
MRLSFEVATGKVTAPIIRTMQNGPTNERPSRSDLSAGQKKNGNEVFTFPARML